MSAQYYTLVAGLRDYALDADAKGFDAAAITDEIMDALTPRDREQVRMLRGWYDCSNLVALRSGRASLDERGNLSPDEAAEELKAPRRLPEALARVVRAYADPEGEDAEGIDTARPFAAALFEAYYARCQREGSPFMRAWSAFDRNLRNVAAAVAARAAGREEGEAVVGSDYVAEQLMRSSAADFGLRGELPYLDAVIAALNDEANLVERERRIDLIRWNEAVELAAFAYFDIDAVLAYLVRIHIVARWMRMDAARGREMLRRLREELDGQKLMDKQ